jgi:hypothetical protein
MDVLEHARERFLDRQEAGHPGHDNPEG